MLKVDIELPSEIQSQSTSDKIRRVDWFGSITLVGTVGCLLLGFSLKSTEELPWTHPIVWGLFVASTVFGCLFVLVETYWSHSPVMPLHLICRRTPFAVAMSYFLSSAVAYSMASILYSWPIIFDLFNMLIHYSCTMCPW